MDQYGWFLDIYAVKRHRITPFDILFPPATILKLPA
jgi:hypothetical protein